MDTLKSYETAKQLRKISTDVQVANDLDLAIPTLHNLKKSKNPTMKTVKMFADYFKMPVSKYIKLGE